MTDVISELTQCEKRRIDALLSNDIEGLRSLTTSDLVHVHANGGVDGQTQYLNAVDKKFEFLKVERPSLDVRIVGEVAVMTGPLNQDVRLKETGTLIEMRAFATQVWVKTDHGWAQSSFQATRLT